ncbi:hypothetical protein BsWGS_19148 [Bradybaena similaris]
MSEKTTFEADPYIRVEFQLERGHGTSTIHEADCSTRTVISGLKEDLSTTFGLTLKEQRWFFNKTELEDSKNLQEYNIATANTPRPVINVKKI